MAAELGNATRDYIALLEAEVEDLRERLDASNLALEQERAQIRKFFLARLAPHSKPQPQPH